MRSQLQGKHFLGTDLSLFVIYVMMQRLALKQYVFLLNVVNLDNICTNLTKKKNPHLCKTDAECIIRKTAYNL